MYYEENDYTNAYHCFSIAYANCHNEKILFNKAISLEKHNIDFLLNKGVVLMELGKFEEAIDSFNKVLLRNPDNEDAFFLKEECLENF